MKPSNNIFTYTYIFKKIICLLVILPVLFLLVNRYPYFQIAAVITLVLLGLLAFCYKFKITSYHKEPIAILLIICIYFIFSYFFSGQSVANFFSYSFLRNDGNFFFCYILFIILAIPFFDYKIVTDLYFKLIFFIFSVFSFFGVVEYFVSKPFLMTSNEPYVGKLFRALNRTHNATGSVYAIVSTFALVFFLKEKVRKKKLCYLLVLVLCVLGLFITKSRGAYLGFTAAIVFVLWVHFRSIKKLLKALLALIVLSLPFIFLTGVYRRIFQIFDFTATTIIRLNLWEKAWYLFSQSPIFGIGFGRYNDMFNFERLKGYKGVLYFYINPNSIFNDSHSHSSYLQFLSETGIIGLGLLILFWILCFVIIMKAYQITRSDFSKKVFLSGAGSIIALFILSLTENYFSAPTVMICVSMVTSLSIGLYWQENKGNNKEILVGSK